MCVTSTVFFVDFDFESDLFELPDFFVLVFPLLDVEVVEDVEEAPMSIVVQIGGKKPEQPESGQYGQYSEL